MKPEFPSAQIHRLWRASFSGFEYCQGVPIARREQAIALLKSGFDMALQMVAAQYVMPICWISAENGRPLILGNGSAFMVDPGGGPFLVTAHHVYEEFCAARAARVDTARFLDDLTKFPLGQRLIASLRGRRARRD